MVLVTQIQSHPVTWLLGSMQTTKPQVIVSRRANQAQKTTDWTGGGPSSLLTDLTLADIPVGGRLSHLWITGDP